MTADERFERIEGTLYATAETLHALATAHAAPETAIQGLIEAQTRNQATLQTLTDSVSRYVDAPMPACAASKRTSTDSSAPSQPNMAMAKATSDQAGR